MSRRLAAPVLLLCLGLALSGCLTPRAKPAPSAAIVAARSAAGAKPPPCQVGDLASISPMVATFPFDEPGVDEVGTRQLAKAAAWLNCNAGVPAVIMPSADNHGTAQHQQELAAARGQAVLAALRSMGAKAAVVQILAAGAADPQSGPHLVIQAAGRGW